MPKLIAHRGYARHFPENTLVAVEAALDVGARFVEIDVQLSRNGVPFLMHDRDLRRMCGVNAALGELDAAQIGHLRAAERVRFGEQFADEPVASLKSFVDAIARRAGPQVFVELKRASIEQLGADAVLDAVLPELEPIASRCTLISFDGAVLQRARARSKLRIGPVLFTWEQLQHPDLRALVPDVIFCDVDTLPASGEFRSLGAPLAVYEVDQPEIALALAARGVEFIETFAIDEMLRALDPR